MYDKWTIYVLTTYNVAEFRFFFLEANHYGIESSESVNRSMFYLTTDWNSCGMNKREKRQQTFVIFDWFVSYFKLIIIPFVIINWKFKQNTVPLSVLFETLMDSTPEIHNSNELFLSHSFEWNALKWIFLFKICLFIFLSFVGHFSVFCFYFFYSWIHSNCVFFLCFIFKRTMYREASVRSIYYINF